MPGARLTTAAFCCALAAPAAMGQITDLTNWDFYRDPDPGPGALQDAMTGSAAANLAELDFINGVPVPAAYDIGFSSINANTVGEATAGYYFSAASDFAVSIDFSITLTNPDGVVALGLGVGEDRAGVNAAGVGMALGTAFNTTAAEFQGAAVNNDSPSFQELNSAIAPFVVGSTYSGSLNVAYDASSGDITVGATGLGGTGATTFTAASDLTAWAGDDLLVSFFLRSDTLEDPVAIGPWDGTSAQADFVNFTVVEGAATQVPEPTSLALLGMGGVLLARRRRNG